MRDSITLLPEPRSAGEARHFVADHAAGIVPDEMAEVAVLLTSELVTNVIVHARTPMRLSVDVVPSVLRVSLADEVSRAPVRRASEGVPRLTGRGMHLVEELSDHWGVEPNPAGKTVWFELSA
jgi:anti-sigma regulatory factor (Ser/Thr protein kinase)